MNAGIAGADNAALDPILPVYEQWCEAVAEIEDLSARVAARIPADVRAALEPYPFPAAAPQDLKDAYDRHYEAAGCGALDEAATAVGDRICDLECRIMETPAASLHGLLAKAHIAQRTSKPGSGSPDGGTLDDHPMIRTVFQDLERLVGGSTVMSARTEANGPATSGAAPAASMAPVAEDPIVGLWRELLAHRASAEDDNKLLAVETEILQMDALTAEGWAIQAELLAEQVDGRPDRGDERVAKRIAQHLRRMADAERLAGGAA